MAKRVDDEPFEFTEEWAAGGVSESSLRRHTAAPPKPARARRGSTTGTPAGPRDWSPTDSVAPRSRRRFWPVLLMVAIAGGIFAVSWFGNHGHSGPAPLAAGPSSAPGLPSDTPGAVVGLSPALKVGRCFDLSNPDASGTVEFRSCSQTHTYEFIALETAAGDNSQYPAETYWQGAVNARCTADLVAYSGQLKTSWPPSLTSTEFKPLPNDWANGNRTVYCAAKWEPARTGPAKNAAAYVNPRPVITSSG